MKYVKYVAIAFLITCCTSAMKVFAGLKDYSFNVPGYNGSVETPLRTDKHLMNREVLQNVTVSPSHDTLDVVLRNSANANVGPWRIIEDGIITKFDSYYETFPSDYKLYIDSRWNYTKPTYTSFTWVY